MAYLLIDPDETLDYTMDWSEVLGARTISASTWTMSPAGPTLSSPSATSDTTTTKVAGCTAGQVYRLINRIETNAGTIEEQSVTLRCEKR